MVRSWEYIRRDIVGQSTFVAVVRDWICSDETYEEKECASLEENHIASKASRSWGKKSVVR